MKKILYILLSIATMVTALSSCINDDFTTSSSDLLSFSTDTVAFDTVITQKGTATKQFIIYNKAKKQINISSIKVAGESSDAKFFLNVDGTKGKEFHDIEIRGEDSIYVFVEAYIDHLSKDEPTEAKDRIELVTNGVTQHVVLTAWGQDVIVMRGDTIKQDTHLTSDRPYLVYDSLTVMPGVTLTIDPGTSLLFHDNAWLKSLGTVKAIGTAEKPITLRGDRLDKVVAQIPFDIMSGQWGGVALCGAGNDWRYVDMRSSSWGLQVYGSDPSVQSLYLLNCVIHNSAGYGFLSANAWVEAEGTEFSDAADDVFAAIGGKIRLTNCTLANNYLFSPNNSGKISNICLIERDEAGTYSTLDCVIANCVSHGLYYDINDIASDLSNTNVWIHNTLFKSDGKDDSHFFNNVWKGDPKFYVNREKYIFDYRLRNGSDAIARGDKSMVPERARYDRYGQDRFAREGVDLGAYVWMPSDDPLELNRK